MATTTALLDACVLYPAQVRDLLLHLAHTGIFRARWTDQIHDEWIRNLVQAGREPQKLARTRALMNQAIRDCLITGYESLITGIELPDPEDRHVLAAAIVGGADVIVTYNLKDFPVDKLIPYGIEPQHPDDFVMELLDSDPQRSIEAIKLQRGSLRRPPKTVDEFLMDLSKVHLDRTVERLREFADLI